MTDERLTGSAWSASDDAGTAGTGESEEVEALTEDIEQTRSEMATTVGAIAERLDPANIAQDAKQTVRDATVGRVEQMASNVADTMDEARTNAMDAGSGIFDTIRSNPIPAAMAGIGIGWLLMNRGGGSSGRRRMDSRGNWQYDRYGSGYGTQGRADMWSGQQAHRQGEGQGGNPIEQVGQQAGEIAGNVGENVGRFAGQARETMGRMPDQVGGTVQDIGGNAQRMVEDNPLAFGALAVAVGAALGMALPETQAEQRVLAPIGDKAVETAEQAADDATRQLEASRS